MTESRQAMRRKKKKPRKFLKVISILIVLLLLAGGGYAYYVYHAVKQTANQMHIDLKRQSKNPALNAGKPINILLLGVDERKGDRGRSDTIIIASLNPKTKSMLLTSIPRDTYVNLPGHGAQKINAAYAFGNVDMAVDTVEKLASIHIDYVAKINFNGLKQLVNAVGGVTVDNDLDWYDEGYYKKGYHYKKGKIHLDGAQALGYVRMRHLDNRGDFGRNKRQRQVLAAVVDKAAGMGGITHMQDILKTLGSNVKTSMTFDDMKGIAQNYRNCREHIYNYEVYGVPQTINRISYVVVSDAEKQKVHNMIQEEQDGTLDMSKYQHKND
ncbi:LCP family protein [Camelliibacillus cellulosilyticus]|uniref:LCP family protein n=1 Tax=Camelliibacillus cellulosilyticus TaxID=2174486 RepID=A0ABV9GNZ9_9BACL